MKSQIEIGVTILACCILAGCSADSIENTGAATENAAVAEQVDETIDISGIERIFIDEYEGQEDRSQCVYKVIERLGSDGFIAIDSENKIDMTNADNMRQFINIYRSGKHAEICVLRIFYSDLINFLSITADKGQVHISQTYYTFQDDHLIKTEERENEAKYFEYTDEGYLMIEGVWNSPEKYVLTLSEEEEHIALRVDPLDEECRKLCEKYVAPVSYNLNNMFITDWKEDDYSDLDLYDVFEKFYAETYGRNFPYSMNDNLSIGNEYEISADELENVILRHFKINPEELHRRLRYDADKKVYIYRPRGFEESDYAEVPYPEVVAYERNNDGSMTLTVNAVYPNGNTSKLFSHKVTVVDENEKVYYLSNEIPGDEELNLWWHADRLSDDEWNEHYKDKNYQDVYVKGYNLPILQSDMDQAEKETEELLDCIEDLYKPYLDDETRIPEEAQENMTDVLANKGYMVRADAIYSNIKNEEMFEAFLTDAKEGKRGRTVLYELRKRGAVARYEYSFDGLDMYVFASGMEIEKNGNRHQTYCTYNRIKTWRYTDTGWFCYELCVPEYPEVTEVVDGSVLIRIKPISEENRLASEKYVFGIGYQGNNILCSDWDIDSLNTLDYTGMYEYLYAMDTGERFSISEDAEGIPADGFETLIMKYIPVSQEIIRRSAAYNSEKEEYYWARLDCMNYSPNYFGTSYPEVVDIDNNDDGTITLTVNAVCEMILNNEAIITHELTVKENADGSFMYMGNKILGDGINRIPAYQYRISLSQREKDRN